MNVLVPMPMTPPLTSGVPAVTGRINLYDATDGELSAALPLIADVQESTLVGFAKADATDHQVVVTCQGADTIMAAVTELPVTLQFQVLIFQVLNGVWWPVGGRHPMPEGPVVDTTSTQVVAHKSMSGLTNTFTDIPPGALGTGRVVGEDAEGESHSYTVVKLTASEYSMLGVKDPDTIYIVVP